jgi:hypothetical protein
MRTPSRRYDEDDEEYNRRVADFEIWRRRIVCGYITSGGIFLLAMLVFIVAIMVGSGAVGGVGGILLATSCVSVAVTSAYHYATSTEYK